MDGSRLTREKRSAARQAVALGETLQSVLAQHFDDASTLVGSVGLQIRTKTKRVSLRKRSLSNIRGTYIPLEVAVSIRRLENLRQVVTFQLVGAKDAEIMRIIAHDALQQLAARIHRASFGALVHRDHFPIHHLEFMRRVIRFADHAHPMGFVFGQDPTYERVHEFVWTLAFGPEPLSRLVAAQPLLEVVELFVVRARLGQRHLVRAETVLERESVQLRQGAPAFGRDELSNKKAKQEVEKRMRAF